MATHWKIQRTLLLVGEGRTEEAFLTYVRQLYVQRGCGLKVTIKNARGKGAKHVIDWTRRQIANVAYDEVAVMLDSDTDWSSAVAKQAKAKKIQVLISEPCFEALMLRLLQKEPIGNANALKKQFAPFINNDSTLAQHYAKCFGTEILQSRRAMEPTIDSLLKLLHA